MHNPIQILSVATPHHNLHNNNHHQQQVSTQQSQTNQHTSPAFLSLLPRSLSSLSLGTRKNKIDKDLLTSTLNNTTDVLPQPRGQEAFNPMSQSLYHHIKANMLSPQQNTQRNLQQQCFNQQQQRFKETLKLSSGSKGKNVFTISKSLIEEDIPPPLPQRNPTRQLVLDLGNPNSVHQFSPISDLDRAGSPQRTSPKLKASNNDDSGLLSNNNNNSTKAKRSKIKAKALSDPKMTTQMFLQMETTSRPMATEDVGTSKKLEVDSCPPPLPPRQPGMLSEEISRGSCQSLAQPNSLSAGYNYPLVSTCTAVQGDNIKVAFPLSQRPNIVQKLQQTQQQPHGCLSTAVSNWRSYA